MSCSRKEVEHFLCFLMLGQFLLDYLLLRFLTTSFLLHLFHLLFDQYLPPRQIFQFVVPHIKLLHKMCTFSNVLVGFWFLYPNLEIVFKSFQVYALQMRMAVRSIIGFVCFNLRYIPSFSHLIRQSQQYLFLVLLGRGFALRQHIETSSLGCTRSVNFLRSALFSSYTSKLLFILGLRAEGILEMGRRVLRVDLMWMRRSSCLSQFLRIYYIATSLLTVIIEYGIQCLEDGLDQQSNICKFIIGR